MNVRWKCMGACLILLIACNEKETDNNAGFEASSVGVQEEDDLKIL
jgi:hypothetical protein